MVRLYDSSRDGALCGRVELNQYEMWTAICRLALERAGLPTTSDFGIEVEGFEMPARASFEMYDGYPRIVIRRLDVPRVQLVSLRGAEVVGTAETETPAAIADTAEADAQALEVKHQQQVDDILGVVKHFVVDILERGASAELFGLKDPLAGTELGRNLDVVDERLEKMRPAIVGVVGAKTEEEVTAQVARARREICAEAPESVVVLGVLRGETEADVDAQMARATAALKGEPRDALMTPESRRAFFNFLVSVDASTGKTVRTEDDIQSQASMAEAIYQRMRSDGATICRDCCKDSLALPRVKYCDRSRGDEPQGKNSHRWVSIDSFEGRQAYLLGAAKALQS